MSLILIMIFVNLCNHCAKFTIWRTIQM